MWGEEYLTYLAGQWYHAETSIPSLPADARCVLCDRRAIHGYGEPKECKAGFCAECCQRLRATAWDGIRESA